MMMENTLKQTILIIDDTPVQLLVIGRILSPLYDVIMATTGEEGLQLAKEYNVDLILLDLYMLDMSGFEVLSNLKTTEETMNIPVIFITSSSSNEDEAEGLAMGAVDYLRKPFTEVVVKLRVEIQLRLISQMKVIENVSMTDGLTGINNRRSFNSIAKSVWDLTKQANECFALLLIDIDEFGSFNDEYGYISGDTCLKVVAETIFNTLEEENHSLFRWGNEEFMILMPGVNLKNALLTAKHIRENVAATSIDLAGETVFTTVSTAVGSIAPRNMDFDTDFMDFLTALNRSLYRTKANGRNREEYIPETYSRKTFTKNIY